MDELRFFRNLLILNHHDVWLHMKGMVLTKHSLGLHLPQLNVDPNGILKGLLRKALARLQIWVELTRIRLSSNTDVDLNI